MLPRLGLGQTGAPPPAEIAGAYSYTARASLHTETGASTVNGQTRHRCRRVLWLVATHSLLLVTPAMSSGRMRNSARHYTTRCVERANYSPCGRLVSL